MDCWMGWMDGRSEGWTWFQWFLVKAVVTVTSSAPLRMCLKKIY